MMITNKLQYIETICDADINSQTLRRYFTIQDMLDTYYESTGEAILITRNGPKFTDFQEEHQM